MAEAASPSAPIVVQKYGGSSVADVARIRSVARRVVDTVQDGHQVVVVVSAMGNTTNELLALARSVTPSPGRRELDLLVSVGERVSMTLLAMAIHDLGVPARSFTGSQSGIITDNNHVAARVEEVRPHRLFAALDTGHVVIVAGFQGVSRGGEVTTLGRGGSDTTAVVLAAALGAEWCELCSDVDGIFTADPRVVPAARRLDTLPLDAAVALSRGGAKVLHAQAVELARTLGVQLHAAATRRPSGSGTRLPPGPSPSSTMGVTPDTALVLHELADLSELPPDVAGAVVHVRPGLHGDVQVWLDTRNLPEATAQSAGRPIATVTAVGRALVVDPTQTAVALTASRCVPIETWWASGESIIFSVAREDANTLTQALHAALVPKRPHT